MKEQKSRRAEKRERAAHHDSGRYLKRHPRKRSDPLTGLDRESGWKGAAAGAVRRYPKLKERERAELAAGGLRAGRRGPSPEEVLIRRSSGLVAAVDKAMGSFHGDRRKRLRAVLWGGTEPGKEDRAILKRFYQLTAVYLGYGDPYWAVTNKKPKRKG